MTTNDPEPETATPEREKRRAKLRAKVADLSDSSDECLLASGELREMQLEDELAAQKIITRSAYAETNILRKSRQKAQHVIACVNQYFPGLVKDAESIASLELRAQYAEKERDELREMLERMTKSQEDWEKGVETIIGRQPQIFTRVIDEARQLLVRTKPAQ